MKTLRTIPAFLLLLLAITNCAEAPEQYMERDMSNVVYEEELLPVASASESKPETFISSSAAVETGKDSTRRFIRTADLRFKVKSVVRSTYNVEAVTVRHGGFVSSSSLRSYVNSTKSKAITADSVLKTTYYTVDNSLVLRVPNVKLDTVLKDIARQIDFLDRREIKADDVALRILKNNLIQRRIDNARQRVTSAIDNRGTRLKETTSAEELLLNKQEQADEAMIGNLTLEDQISFSTITIDMYQDQSLKRELIANEENINEYKPGFGTRFVDALKTGWEILEILFFTLINIWPLLILGGIIYLVIKWRVKNKKNKQE